MLFEESRIIMILNIKEKLKKRRALVTGGAGFIGSNLVKLLLEKGDDVVVVDNLFQGKKERLSSDVEFINLDIRSEKLLDIKNVEVIFHLGAFSRIQPSFKQPYFAMDNNVLGTTNVLELARKVNAKVVYAGSSSFYFSPYANPYAFTKWLGEESCRMYTAVYNVKTAIARFFNCYGNCYGPNQPTEEEYSTVVGIFERQKKAGLPLTVTGTGEKRRDFTHVYDIVNGLYQISLGEWNAEVFNLGTGKNYSIMELAKLFEPQEIVFIPDRVGEAQTTLADISFTKEKLEWTPTIELSDYIKNFLLSLNSSKNQVY